MLRKLLFSTLFVALNLSFCFAADKTVDANKEALQKLQDFIGEWKGNIEGIDSKMLLNVMIKQGVFER